MVILHENGIVVLQRFQVSVPVFGRLCECRGSMHGQAAPKAAQNAVGIEKWEAGEATHVVFFGSIWEGLSLPSKEASSISKVFGEVVWT